MKLISIVTPTFNEEDNIEEIYNEVKKVMQGFPNYAYEHIFIDNASTDTTVEKLKAKAKIDKSLKIIVNSRNFGAIRSPYYGHLQAKGDAVVDIPADLQDPPALIADFIKKWEEGFKVVVGVKTISRENSVMYFIRSVYYKILKKVSETEIVEHSTGFGLYDKSVIEIMKKIDDPYPLFRSVVSEIGFERAKVEYVQERRKKGISSGNYSKSFYRLYDAGVLGIMSSSKLPLRIAIFLGFIMSFLSLLVSIGYLVLKIFLGVHFQVGFASLIIGLFFFLSVQLFFIGVLGEYIGAIYTQVLRRPIVIEKERINFD